MKKRLMVCVLVVAGGIAVGSFGVTLAGYVATAQITRTVYDGALMKKSIFLNANIWESDHPVYHLFAWNSSGNKSSGKYLDVGKNIEPTIGGIHFNMYVYEYDTEEYDRIQFYRVNPRCYQETNVLEEEASDYKVVGIGGDWGYGDSGYSFYQLSFDSNRYVANHVQLTAGDEIKVWDGTDGSEGWYSCNVNGNHYTLKNGEQGGNLVISDTGIYTIDFYKEHNEGNHLTFWMEGNVDDFKWNWTNEITYSPSVNYYCITDWGGGDYDTNNLSLNVDGDLQFDS